MFNFRKSVHHHTIQTIQPTRCKSFTSLLLNVYVWLNIVVGRGLADHDQQRSSRFSPTVKPEASSAVVCS